MPAYVHIATKCSEGVSTLPPTAVGEEAVRSQSALLSRVGALEGEIAKLKGAIAAVEEQAKAALEEKK